MTDNKQLTAEEFKVKWLKQINQVWDKQFIIDLDQLLKEYSAQQNDELIKEAEGLKKVISEWEQFCKAANESISEKVEYIDELIKEIEKLKGQKAFWIKQMDDIARSRADLKDAGDKLAEALIHISDSISLNTDEKEAINNWEKLNK